MTDRRAQRWFDKVRDACNDLNDEDDRNAFIDAVVGASEYYLSVKDAVPKELMVVGSLEVMYHAKHRSRILLQLYPHGCASGTQISGKRIVRI